ncbi:MAG: response regulator [Desulfovibrionaceae bacterium]
MRILIVDDSLASRCILTDVLSRHGVCEQAENGEQAVALFEASLREGRPFNLLIMDVMMPGMDGLEATRRIVAMQDAAAVPPEDRARVVMVTCLDNSSTVINAQFDSGVDYFLTKPFDLETLTEALRCLDIETDCATIFKELRS